jgi:hypothetical protein
MRPHCRSPRKANLPIPSQNCEIRTLFFPSLLRAANTFDDLKTRRRIIVLANQERVLRVKKLYHQIGNLCTTYDTTRHDDERAASVEIPINIDTTHAAKTLMDYVFIAPAVDDKSGEKRTQTIPASNYLLDTLPDPVE